jgi:carbonic anhydrase
MKPSTVVRLGTIAHFAVFSLGMVACRQPGVQKTAGGTPVPGASTATTADPVWHYEGDEGPAHWGAISAKFAACQSGRAQSPIDIVAPARRETSEAIALKFAPADLRIVHQEHVADAINNGHTIQVNYSEGDTLTAGGRAYQLVQYHFHAPSEHTVNGKQFPMEMHLVHRDAEGQLAVIGVLISEGAHNAAFDPIWENLPVTKGVEHHLEHVKVDVDALLPQARTTYRYEGSLTTPPCSEGVQWFVMTTPIALSAAQIGAFTALFHGNNRPVQSLNERPVLTDKVGGTD